MRKRYFRGTSCALLAVCSCAVGPDYHTPATQMPERWVGASTTQPAAPATQPVDIADWWESLGDPQLTSLIRRAAAENLDLRVAQARVLEARALRDIAAADYWPQVNLGSSYQYRGSSRNDSPKPASSGGGPRLNLLNRVLRQFRVTPASIDPNTGALVPPMLSYSPSSSGLNTGGTDGLIGGTSSTGGGLRRDQNLYQLGFDATWELDVFGRIRRSVEATDADLEALEDDRRNVLITLISEVARIYAQLRGAQRRLAIARENIAVQQDTLNVTQDRWQAGFTTELDVAQAQTQLETTRSQLPLLETNVRQASFQLAVLLARHPDALLEELGAADVMFDPPASSTQPADRDILLAFGRSSPPSIPIGLPADLLRRRPDIRSAERQLAAQTARIGVATAELFPQLSLTGSFGTSTTEFRHILDQHSFTWGVGPAIQWPIFTAGRIQANIRAEEAREAQALATYGQTVLIALQEVESSLVAYDQERRRLETLIAAVRAGQRATQLSNELYTRGLGPFLNVLEAQRALYITQDEMVLSETAVVTNLIALYKALGGGWESTSLTTQPAFAEAECSD